MNWKQASLSGSGPETLAEGRCVCLALGAAIIRAENIPVGAGARDARARMRAALATAVAAQRRPMENPDLNSKRLAELLNDQREHWQRGEPLAVEEYVRQYPEIANEPEALLDLVVQEYFCRKRRGETPELDEFVRR